MLLIDLKDEAIRNGENKTRVSTAINPLMSYYRKYQSSVRKEEPVDYHRAGYSGSKRYLYAGGISLDDPATVEWYIENIRDINSYDFSRIKVPEFGKKSFAFMNYLIDTYYAPEPEIDMYEMPPGQDY